MAKSKNGGTRSYIRGRVGAEVYSLGKDGGGKKQQVVRSIAETVANPQTEAQMRGRMIMSTVMQAAKVFKPIIDHSFDGVPTGQPSISQFISRNYELVKADVAAHPASGNEFGLNEYQEKGAKNGKWLVSQGKAQWPASMEVDTVHGGIMTVFVKENPTLGYFKELIGWTEGDFYTILGLNSSNKLAYARFSIKPGMTDSTVLSDANIETFFDIETNGTASVAFLDQPGEQNKHSVNFNFTAPYQNGGGIFSKKTAKGYIHSTCQLDLQITAAYTADVALPTYPQGEELFLNGGDI